MTADHIAPSRATDAFHCPHCAAYAHQVWSEITVNFYSRGYDSLQPQIMASMCSRCDNVALWIGDLMIYPPSVDAPPPHNDLAEPARSTYVEARAVAGTSPRSAAALLRLCLQQLVKQLGARSSNLNAAVRELVALGLPVRIQQAMDTVRLLGNEAVHPGTIDLTDDPQMAFSLFDMVNIVVESMVTQPRLIEELHGSLPPAKVEAVQRRDGGDSYENPRPSPFDHY